jgi:hypothetical protein
MQGRWNSGRVVCVMTWVQERLEEGLDIYELLDHPLRDGGATDVLPVGEATHIIRRVSMDEATARLRRALAEAGLPVGLDATERELREHIVRLLEMERLALRRIDIPRPRITYELPAVNLSDLIEPPIDEPVVQPERTYFAFRLVDDAGTPMAGRTFRAELPDGRRVAGETDEAGRFRLRDVEVEGEATVYFDDS